MMPESTPRSTRFALVTDPALGTIEVDLESYFDFHFWLAEELDDLVACWNHRHQDVTHGQLGTCRDRRFKAILFLTYGSLSGCAIDSRYHCREARVGELCYDSRFDCSPQFSTCTQKIGFLKHCQRPRTTLHSSKHQVVSSHGSEYYR